jgi:hypothetical protein
MHLRLRNETALSCCKQAGADSALFKRSVKTIRTVLRTMSEFWYIPAVLRLSTTCPIALSTLVAIAATLLR